MGIRVCGDKVSSELGGKCAKQQIPVRKIRSFNTRTIFSIYPHQATSFSLFPFIIILYYLCAFPSTEENFPASLYRPATARPPQTSLPPLELVPELIQHHHNHPTHSSMSPSTTRTEPAVPLSPPERVLVRVCGCLAIAHLIIEQT